MNIDLFIFRKWPARRLLTAAAAAASALAMAGCKVGPNYKPPSPDLPAQYREPTTGPTPAPAAPIASSEQDVRWWRRFDDDRLASLVERAVAANKGIQVAQARLRQARAARQIAQSLLYPQVGIGGSVMRFRGSEAGIGVPVASNLEDNLFQIGFDAAWQVDLFGGTRRLVESARANEQGADAQRRAVVLMVASETARAYLELRGAQRQLEVAKATLDDQHQTLAVTKDKNKNGLASTLEVVRARAEAEATASEIPPIEQAIRQYIHVLSTFLALEPTALSDELMPIAAIPAAPKHVDAGVPSDLLRRRPDIQAAEHHLASATAMVGVATAQLFPQMLLGGSGGLASRKAGDLFNGNTNDNSSSYYLTGTSINWTLFDAGRRKAAIKLSEAEVDAAKASYSDAVLGAFREVESALVAVDRAQARVADLKRLTASTREAVQIAQRDYRTGLLDQLTVLDAQRQSSRADMLLAQGEVALVVDVVTLYKAVGGGWEYAEPLPSTQPLTAAHEKGNAR